MGYLERSSFDQVSVSRGFRYFLRLRIAPTYIHVIKYTSFWAQLVRTSRWATKHALCNSLLFSSPSYHFQLGTYKQTLTLELLHIIHFLYPNRHHFRRLSANILHRLKDNVFFSKEFGKICVAPCAGCTFGNNSRGDGLLVSRVFQPILCATAAHDVVPDIPIQRLPEHACTHGSTTRAEVWGEIGMS